MKHVVLLYSCTHKDAYLLVFPFILKISACNLYVLSHVASVAKNTVVQVIESVFESCADIALQFFYERIRIAILRSANCREVLCASVGIKISVCSEVTFATYVLKATIERQVMAVVWRIIVPSQRASIDIVSQLLGKVCLVSRKVDIASASSIFANMMIFGCDFCII